MKQINKGWASKQTQEEEKWNVSIGRWMETSVIVSMFHWISLWLYYKCAQFRCIYSGGTRNPNCSLFDLFEIQSKPIKKVWLSDLMIRRSARPIHLLLCFAPKRQYRISKTFHRTHTHKNTFNRFQRLSWLFCIDCPKRLYLPLPPSHYLYLLLHLEQKPQIVGGLTIILLLYLVQVEKGTELSVFVFRLKSDSYRSLMHI